jgi:serine/threonine-protein kinase OSR1/STK39
MKVSRHKNIVREHATFIDGNYMWIVMTIIDAGSMVDIMNLLKTNSSIGITNEKIIATIIREVMNALLYLH